MPKIDIREKDETRSGVISENTDIVFVPGFVNYAGLKEEKVLEIGEMRQFDSISDFTDACGTRPVKVKMDNIDGELMDDRGYLMAKELLAAGLSVVYGRMNPDHETVEYFTAIGDKAPSDWETAYFTYFKTENTSDVGCVPVAKQATVPTYSPAEYRQPMVYYSDIANQLKAWFVVENNNYGLTDKGNISVKYLTSGGYPSYVATRGTIKDQDGNDVEALVFDDDLAAKMINMASTRGDCVALIDYSSIDDIERVSGKNDFTIDDLSTYVTKSFGNMTGEYGAMFAPWAKYNRATSGGDDEDMYLPASFGYLSALARSIKIYPNFLAIAGAVRGQIPALAGIRADEVIPNTVADKIQDRDTEELVSINSITRIKPYGDVIWGNRTMKKISEDLVAGNFLNLRNMISDIKKVVYSAARALTFEQDSDILWLNFKSRITPLMDRMVSGNGLTGYKIIKDTENINAKKKGVLCAKIILYPAYAVEDFYITVIMRDADDVTVE